MTNRQGKDNRNSFEKSEQVFRAVIDRVKDLIFLTELTEAGEAGNLLEVNQRAADVLDSRRKELLGSSPKELDGDQVGYILPGSLEKLQKEGSTEFERVQETARGNKIHFELKSHLIEREGQQMVLTVGREISERSEPAQRVKKNQERLEKALNAGGLAWWSMELPSGIVNFHERKATMLGYSPDRFDHYEDFTDLIHPDEYEAAMESMREHLRGEKERYEIEYRLKKKGGGYKWFHDAGSISESDDGSDHKIVTGIIMDVDKRKRAEMALIREREKLRKLHDAVDKFQQCGSEQELCNAATEATQNVLNFNYCTFYCYENSELVPISTTTTEGAKELPPREMDQGPAGRSFKKQETMIGNTDEDDLHLPLTRRDLKSYISVPIGNVGVFLAASIEDDGFGETKKDLAEVLAGHLHEEIKRIRLEEELRNRAIQDPLTRLYNRRYFNESLKKEIERSERYDEPIGFVMIDINRFKEINDRHSHQVGDEVLKEVADLLSSNVRDADSVVRYGGDEFLIMMPETTGEVSTTVTRLRKKLADWNEQSDLLDFQLNLAIGVSHWDPDQERNVSEAIKEADEKMYQDKDS